MSDMVFALLMWQQRIWKHTVLTRVGVLIVGALMLPLLCHAEDSPLPTLPAFSPQLAKERKKGQLNHIYQIDNTPLGDRIPLIIVPGRAQEFQRNSWWKRIVKMADKHPVYSQHYKFYAYIYRSKEKIERLADGFTQEATQLAHSMPSNRQMILITYSLGGVIVQESLLRNPKLLDRTQAIFAVTVPFHGSPFFNPIWFTEGLVPINYSPIRLFWDRLTYYVYMFDKANLPQGIRWDNFDQSQPDLDVRIPFDPTTVIQPGARLTVHERQIRSFKDKLIIYATYLNNRYTEPPKQRPLLEQVPLKLFNGIKEIPGAILPFYGFTAHSVMITGNHWLSNLPTFDPKTGNARNIHLFRYNDGVIPLSSQLYLQPRNVPYDNRIDELITAIDVYKARIFVNLDHIDIGEYRMPRSYTRAIDILNPAEGKRSPIEWILFDLQELMPQRPIARAQKVSLDHYILSPPSGLPRT